MEHDPPRNGGVEHVLLRIPHVALHADELLAPLWAENPGHGGFHAEPQLFGFFQPYPLLYRRRYSLSRLVCARLTGISVAFASFILRM